MSKNEDLKYDFAIADSDIVDENKEIISDDEADVDDNMVFRAKAGDEKSLNHILKKYRNFVRAKAKPFFIVGADKEDILQEGMIGLFKAIRDYDEEKTVSFRAFAELCVTRQIITAVKTATRQKHIPLNSYISLNKPMSEEDPDKTLMDMMKNSHISDPEQLIISKEEMKLIEEKTKEMLSEFETRVLSLYLKGYSYNEISEKLCKHPKSVDNALQRIKRKFEKYLEQRE
ncbi:RNA polymerase sporulation sigma factor SigH [Acetoanaerobium noterae]|uniref:RNA polymerase sporulation sigma factor SigH n=1 Tax=Acetoanaerobium noterae TaxID=745369 RepID=UPI003241DBB3